MVHHEACPLCSSRQTGLKFRCRDHFVSGSEFPVFQCLSCGFSFTQDYPEENEIGNFYESDDYISHNDTAPGFSNKLYRIARRMMLKRKKNLVNKITKLNRGTILDIGSGTGYFANVMQESGWKARGIEINEKARSFSAERFGLEVIAPDKIRELESASFDCITLWHVLEHFHDPNGYISEVRRLLKPGSFCIIALPNSGSSDARHYGKFWAAWDVPRHLWHFNPETFRVFSDKAGLTTEGTKILPLDVFYISSLSEKYRGSALPFITGMARAFFFFAATCFNSSRSSSVIYILKKPLD